MDDTCPRCASALVSHAFHSHPDQCVAGVEEAHICHYCTTCGHAWHEPAEVIA